MSVRSVTMVSSGVAKRRVRRRRWSRSEPIDPTHDLGEQHPWHRRLGQLEHQVAAVAHDRTPILPSVSPKVVSDQRSISADPLGLLATVRLLNNHVREGIQERCAMTAPRAERRLVVRFMPAARAN